MAGTIVAGNRLEMRCKDDEKGYRDLLELSIN
jgi:hypothetical protein